MNALGWRESAAPGGVWHFIISEEGRAVPACSWRVRVKGPLQKTPGINPCSRCAVTWQRLVNQK